MWNYRNLAGEEWNNKPLEYQMETLKRYYPIGSTFQYISPDPYSDTPHFIPKGKVIIQGYVIADDNMTGLSYGTKWYVLKIKNIGKSNKEENMHPGFFEPDKQSLRNEKISILLDELPLL